MVNRCISVSRYDPVAGRGPDTSDNGLCASSELDEPLSFLGKKLGIPESCSDVSKQSDEPSSEAEGRFTRTYSLSMSSSESKTARMTIASNSE